MNAISHVKLKKTLLSDPKTAAAYDDLAEEYILIREMLRARKRAGLTQEAVAKHMHTTTSVISRLESLPDLNKNQPSPSFNTLKRYARAVGCVLQIKFVLKKPHS